MVDAAFNIDLKEKFPHLPAAPIVEAVIHWLARAGRPLEPDDLKAKLAELLPDYPYQEPQHQFALEIQTMITDKEPYSTTSRHGGWHGWRVSTIDRRYIAQFTRDGLVFSRLRPYESWERFSAEARRLWKMFVQIAEPAEVQRLGVRFINRIVGTGFENLKKYLKDPPTCPSSLPLSAFLYQSTFQVPGHPFEIRIVKTMQPEILASSQNPGLIVDIDVFASKSLACDDQTLDEVLPKMRWLKNKIFFDLLTDEAIRGFKGG